MNPPTPGMYSVDTRPSYNLPQGHRNYPGAPLSQTLQGRPPLHTPIKQQAPNLAAMLTTPGTGAYPITAPQRSHSPLTKPVNYPGQGYRQPPPLQPHPTQTTQPSSLKAIPKAQVVLGHGPQPVQPVHKAHLSAAKSGDFQDVLFETIEDFDQKNKLYGGTNDFNKIAKLLLPLDVFVLYSEHKDISKDFKNKMEAEKKMLSEDIDNFLKEVILMMEKIKEKLFMKVDGFHQGFVDYYNGFLKKVQDFLKNATQTVMTSKSMQDYQDMRKSLNENDPLSKEIGIFKKKKEQATQIEALFRRIKDNYKSYQITDMKNTLDNGLSKPVLAYNRQNSLTFLKKQQADLATKLFNDPNINKDNIVGVFSPLGRPAATPLIAQTPQTKEQGRRIIHNPAFNNEAQNTQSPPQQPETVYANPIHKPEKPKTGPRVHFQDAPRPSSGANPHGQVNPIHANQRPRTPPPQRADPHLAAGSPSIAQISPNNTEVILKYNPKTPTLNKRKTLNFGSGAPKVLCIKALDSRNVAIGCKDGSLYLVDTEVSVQDFLKRKMKLDGPIKAILPEAERESSRALGAPRKLFCTIGGAENCIAALEFGGGKTTISKMRGHQAEINDLIHFLPGRLFSCGSDGNVGLWNTQSQAPLAMNKVHSSMANSICLMNNKKTLLSAGQDCRILIHDVDANGTLKNVAELKDYYPIRKISSFHNNTNFAVAASEDGMIKVWNINKKE